MSRSWGILIAAVAISWSPDAEAESGAEALPWIGITGGIGTCAMGDVNDEIRELDALLIASFDEISKGLGFGVDAGVNLGDSWSLSGHFLRLMAGSDVSDPTGSLDYSLGANAVYATVDYLPSTGVSPRFGIGISGGVVMAAGTIDASFVGIGAESGDVSGNGPYFDVHGFVETPIGSVLTIVPSVGYRHAITSEVEMDGQPVYTYGGDRYDVDYSGIFAHLSIRIGLSDPSGSP